MNEIETRSCELYETSAQTLEVRFAPSEGEGKPNRLTGYAAVFNSLSADLGGWRERILPGAFKASLSSGQDIRALVDHDFTRLLGRTSNGTLRLAEDATGLRVEIDVPDTTYGRDILTSVKRGDIKGMSFGFRVMPDGERFTKDGNVIIRELTNVDLRECTVTSIPAYGATSIAVRADIADRIKAQARPGLSQRQMKYRRQIAQG